MVSIKAEKREIKGKAVKSLRKQGKIPAVLYGMGEKELLLTVLEKDFDKVFREAGENTLVELEVGGGKKNVMIHDVSFDPVKDKPLHVDFYQVRMDKPIRARVPLVFEGESPAAKNSGGVVVKVIHEIEVEALPMNLPHEIRVDLSKLVNFGDRIAVGDVPLAEGVKLILDEGEVLVLVEEPRAEEETPAEEPSLESIEVTGKKEKKEGEEDKEEVEEKGKEKSKSQEAAPKKEES